MSKQQFFVSIALLLVTTLAFSVCAQPVTLKCVTSDGTKAEDLTIDLETHKMVWGKHTKYDVIHVNDDYISAYQDSFGVGGEVWVIDRKTGDYTRAVVAMLYSESENPEDARLTASTYRGRCVKQLF